jgi:hypothetical protein
MRPLAQSSLCVQVAPTTPSVTAVHVGVLDDVGQVEPSTHKFAVNIGSHACPSFAGGTQLPQGACAIVPRHSPLWHCTPF